MSKKKDRQQAVQVEERDITSVAAQLDAMTRWAQSKVRTLANGKGVDDSTEIFVYAALLDESATVTIDWRAPWVEIRLARDDAKGIVWWDTFFAADQHHRCVLGVFDSQGALLFEQRLASRSSKKVAAPLYRKLRDAGVPKERLEVGHA